MSANRPRPRKPRYLRQREANRPDRAYCKIAGRRIQLGEFNSPESFQRFAEVVAGDDNGAATTPRPAATEPTLSMLMVDFLDYAITKYGGDKASQVVHFKGAFRVLRTTCGSMPAKDFGPRRYKEMRLAMIRENWSRGYIGDQCQRIRRFIGWGVSEERLPPYARHALDAVPGLSIGEFNVREGREVLPVPDDVIEATLPYCKPVVGDMMRIQRLTGMRPGETCQLATKYIDRDRDDDIWFFRPPRHKCQRAGKKRCIPLGPQAQAILRPYLFSTDKFFPYTTASYRVHIHRACRRAGIGEWSPNPNTPHGCNGCQGTAWAGIHPGDAWSFADSNDPDLRPC